MINKLGVSASVMIIASGITLLIIAGVILAEHNLKELKKTEQAKAEYKMLPNYDLEHRIELRCGSDLTILWVRDTSELQAAINKFIDTSKAVKQMMTFMYDEGGSIGSSRHKLIVVPPTHITPCDFRSGGRVYEVYDSICDSTDIDSMTVNISRPIHATNNASKPNNYKLYYDSTFHVYKRKHKGKL